MPSKQIAIRNVKTETVAPAELAKREGVFRTYRDLGPTRSYKKLMVAIAGAYGKISARTLNNWSLQDKGKTLAIEMTSTTSTNSVTMALTNVSGGTASTTCTWNGANQRLILVALGSTWEVIKQDGVTLS